MRRKARKDKRFIAGSARAGTSAKRRKPRSAGSGGRHAMAPPSRKNGVTARARAPKSIAASIRRRGTRRIDWRSTAKTRARDLIEPV
jgi:hypothetical protein